MNIYSPADVFRNAQNLWKSELREANQYAIFEQRFTRTKENSSIAVRISVDNRYMLTINGRVYPQAQSYADFPFYKVYDEVKISAEWLVCGENVLEVLAYCQYQDSQNYYQGIPGVIFEILEDGEVIAYSHESTTRVHHVSGYFNGPMERVSGQQGYTFFYDSTLVRDEVQVPFVTQKAAEYYPRPIPQLVISDREAVRVCSQGVFREDRNKAIVASGDGKGKKKVYSDDSAKEDREPAVPVGNRMLYTALRHVDKRRLFGNTENTVLPGQTLSAVMEDTWDGIYLVLDLGKEMAGYLELDFAVEKETEVLIGWGEHLDDLRVRTNISGRQFACTYRAKAGENKFLHTIVRIAGRYLQLHFYTDKVELSYAGIRSVDYPVERRELPLNLNYLQQRIMEVSVDTLCRCMHEHYEDTPWREQCLYAMDSRNQIICGYEAFGETVLPRANLLLMSKYHRENGLLELCAPCRNTSIIPAFNLIWLVELKEYYDYAKDLEFIGEIIAPAENLLQVYLERMQDGLLHNLADCWNYYEWTDNMGYRPKEGADSPLNAFLAMALSGMVQLEWILGREEQAAGYEEVLAALKERYHETFYCEEKKAYRLSASGEGREMFPELGQALSIVAGLCTEEVEASLCERLLTDSFLPRVSLSHQTFAYEALLKQEERRKDGVNRARILEDIDRKWGAMLFQGATTFWETELGAEDFGNAGSLCHGWSATPVYFYSKLLRKE